MFFGSFSIEELEAITRKYTDVFVRETRSGVLLFTEQGARLLGLYPSISGNNALWVNPELDTVLKLSQPEIGGERLWISPERNFYYENPRDFEGYRIPFEIDPGDYILIDNSECLVFENMFSLLEYDCNKIFDNSCEKRSFRVIVDPYDTGLAYAGVEIIDTIIVDAPEVIMSAWSIGQVYTSGISAPGTVLIPTKATATPISYFDPVEPHRLTVGDHYIRFRIDGKKSSKIGILPRDVSFNNPCKILYITPSPSNSTIWHCVIKCSNDIPHSQEQCVDMAKSDINGPRGAVQVFNTDHGFSKPAATLPCGELGLQFIKGNTLGNKTVSRAAHQLLSYSGTKSDILELARMVLCCDSVPQIYTFDN